MLSGKLMWGKRIKLNLLKQKSFGEVSSKSQAGFWMQKKYVKTERSIARNFHTKVVGNGHTSFWFDRWSELGVLSDLLGERGIIDMRIRRGATVEEGIQNTRRKRRHRSSLLSDIEKSWTQSELHKAMQLMMLIRGGETLVLNRTSQQMRRGFLLRETTMKKKDNDAMYLGEGDMVFAGYSEVCIYDLVKNVGQIVNNGLSFSVESRNRYHLCYLQKCSRNQKSFIFE